MKLTMIMYLHESVNRKALTAANPVIWFNFLEILDYMSLPLTASLVKFLYKLDPIWEIIP